MKIHIRAWDKAWDSPYFEDQLGNLVPCALTCGNTENREKLSQWDTNTGTEVGQLGTEGCFRRSKGVGQTGTRYLGQVPNMATWDRRGLTNRKAPVPTSCPRGTATYENGQGSRRRGGLQMGELTGSIEPPLSGAETLGSVAGGERRAVVTETFEEFRLAVARGERPLAGSRAADPAGANLLSLTPGWLRSESKSAPWEQCRPLPLSRVCGRCRSIVLGTSSQELNSRLRRHRETRCRESWPAPRPRRGPVLPALRAAQPRTGPPEGPGTG